MNCERCGMFIYDGPILTMAQLIGSEPIAGDEPLAKDEHVCPKPYTLETARWLLEFHATTRFPMHPRDYARCVLAYKTAGRESELAL